MTIGFNRSVAPLKPAEDAFILDTSELDADQAFKAALSEIEKEDADRLRSNRNDDDAGECRRSRRRWVQTKDRRRQPAGRYRQSNEGPNGICLKNE